TTANFPNSWDDQGQAIVQQADGKLLVVGTSQQNAGGYNFALARFNGNGTRDLSFGVNGLVTTDIAGASDFAQAVPLQAAGKIVVGGSSDAGGTADDVAAARFTTASALDPIFGTVGLARVNFSGGSQDVATGMALQADGKIVLAGWSWTGGVDFALVR